MANKTLNTRIILRNDTATNWVANNTKVLLKGEIGLETDTGKYKVGDGSTTWGNLPYYTHLASGKATSLDTLISMLNNDEFGNIDDVTVNGTSVVNSSTKVAAITIGSLTTSTTAQSVPLAPESFTGSITLHKIAKTGNYADLIDKLESVDNLNSTSTVQPLSANQGRLLNSIIQGLSRATSYSTISALITALNSASATDFDIGNDLYILATGVPDFWISGKENSSSTYTYTTDDAFVSAISTNGYVQVGYYNISMLETEKVDLTNYVPTSRTIAGVDLVDDITVAELKTALDFDDKMDKANPTGTGTFSLNRRANTTIGAYSFAVGYHTEASGEGSHAVGYHTEASGDGSHAEGWETIASGIFSHAEGLDTIAQRKSQHTFGEYNIADTSGVDGTQQGTYVEIVGNGTGPHSRSNARTLDWNGNEVLAGTLQTTGLKDGNNANYKITLPNTTSWTSNRELLVDGDTFILDGGNSNS